MDPLEKTDEETGIDSAGLGRRMCGLLHHPLGDSAVRGGGSVGTDVLAGRELPDRTGVAGTDGDGFHGGAGLGRHGLDTSQAREDLWT